MCRALLAALGMLLQTVLDLAAAWGGFTCVASLLSDDGRPVHCAWIMQWQYCTRFIGLHIKHEMQPKNYSLIRVHATGDVFGHLFV